MVIIAAVDRSDSSEHVVRVAESLGEAYDDVVHIVHVLSQSEFIDLQQQNIEDSGTVVEMDDVTEFAAEIATDVASEYDITAEPVGLMGNVANQVLDYADKQDARFIVIAPKKRSPTGKALFGSDAQKILLNADCPVVSKVAR